MAKMLITMYPTQGRDDRGPVAAGQEPNLGTIVADTTVAGGVSAQLAQGTTMVRCHAVDGALALRIGKGATSPAANTAPVLPAGAIEYFGVDAAVVKAGAVVAIAAA